MAARVRWGGRRAVEQTGSVDARGMPSSLQRGGNASQLACRVGAGRVRRRGRGSSVVRSSAPQPPAGGRARVPQHPRPMASRAAHARRGREWEMRKSPRHFAAQLREWRRPISAHRSLAVSALLPAGGAAPDASAESWRVQYLLQAVDDPSLMIPAEDAWNARGRKASILKERGFNAREYLLAALGQASRHVPANRGQPRSRRARRLRTRRHRRPRVPDPDSLLLEQAGFGVMLPAWWTRKGTKLRLSARASVKSPKMEGGGMSLENVLRGRLGGRPGRRDADLESWDLAQLKRRW